MAYVWGTEQFIHFCPGVHTQKNEAKEQAKLPNFGRPSALEQFVDELTQPAVTQTLAALSSSST